MLLSLSHANIVQFYGIHVSENDDKYIVTEFMSKGNLRDLLVTEFETLTIQDLLLMYV